jgi:hypothetical protein
MLFGLSFPKVMLVVVLGFFLFFVPLMTFITILVERRRRRSQGAGARGRRDRNA